DRRRHRAGVVPEGRRGLQEGPRSSRSTVPVSGPLHTVHVRVNDAATGQPTPCRVRFIGPEGEYLAPFGRLTNFATRANLDVGGNLFLRDRRYAYIDGTCEIDFPAGQIIAHVSKGPEYTALR